MRKKVRQQCHQEEAKEKEQDGEADKFSTGKNYII